MQLAFDEWRDARTKGHKEVPDFDMPNFVDYRSNSELFVSDWSDLKFVHAEEKLSKDRYLGMSFFINGMLAILFIPFALTALLSKLEFLSPVLFVASVGFAMNAAGKFIELRAR